MKYFFEIIVGPVEVDYTFCSYGNESMQDDPFFIPDYCTDPCPTFDMWENIILFILALS